MDTLESGFEYQWKTVVSINDLVIFSYDLKKEKHKYLSTPNSLIEVPSDQPSLKVLKGCWHLFNHRRKTHFVVWLVRELGVDNSWIQLLKVSLDHLQDLGYPRFPT